MRNSIYLLLGWLIVALTCSSASAEVNWPRFRGPLGDGTSNEKQLPVKWDSSNVVWKTDLLGIGQSSPVIWGDKIFLTAAEKKGEAVERHVMCLSRQDGKQLWSDLATSGEAEKLHRMNSYATATCATDGEHVVAFFGRGGIHCYSVDGKKLWSRDLGSFTGPWGTAASPVIVGDLVIQNCDADADAYIVGLNKRTGEVAWKTSRSDIRGWSTPILIEAGKRQELVVNGDKGVQAYNPQTGSEYWFCKSFTGRGSPMPAFGHGLLFSRQWQTGRHLRRQTRR